MTISSALALFSEIVKPGAEVVSTSTRPFVVTRYFTDPPPHVQVLMSGTVVGGEVEGGGVIGGAVVIDGPCELFGTSVFVGNVDVATLVLPGNVVLLEGCVEGVPTGGSVTMGLTGIAPSTVVVVINDSTVVVISIGSESPGESGTAIFEPPPRF